MNHYAILGLGYGATREEIKKAHRKLALRFPPLPRPPARHQHLGGSLRRMTAAVPPGRHHPDKGGHAGKFREIQESYAVLSDEAAKATYDALRKQQQAGGERAAREKDVQDKAAHEQRKKARERAEKIERDKVAREQQAAQEQEEERAARSPSPATWLRKAESAKAGRDREQQEKSRAKGEREEAVRERATQEQREQAATREKSREQAAQAARDKAAREREERERAKKEEERQAAALSAFLEKEEQTARRKQKEKELRAARASADREQATRYWEREFFIDNLLVRIRLIIEMVLVNRPCAMGV